MLRPEVCLKPLRHFYWGVTMGGFAGGIDDSGTTYTDAPALSIVSDYIGDSRTLLQDTIQPYRYQDNELITALNVAMMDARRLRPDLFLGDLIETYFDTIGTFNVGSPGRQVPVEYPFRLAVLYGMCAHALTRDQEDVQDARAAAFLQIFVEKLTGTKA